MPNEIQWGLVFCRKHLFNSTGIEHLNVVLFVIFKNCWAAGHMALQDLCNLQHILLESEAAEQSPGRFGEKAASSYESGLHSSSLLDFYIPVAECLDESPIKFGQIRSDQNSCSISSESSPLPSLPFVSSQPVPLPFPMAHGTTTLAFVFQGGVLAAADTRSSCSGLVACPASQKILPIHSHLVGTTSGTSADCALWKRILSRELRLYQLRNGRRLSTSGAAKLLSHMLHPFKGTELCVAATLCGWDDHSGSRGPAQGQKTDLEAVSSDKVSLSKSSFLTPQPCARKEASLSGPSLFYVCSDGSRLQGTLFSVGSGSPYAYSILDQGVQWGLTVAEATSIAREAVYRATYRDAYSGNCVDIYHVTSQGWTRRTREDLKEEYYREKESRRQTHEAEKKMLWNMRSKRQVLQIDSLKLI